MGESEARAELQPELWVDDGPAAIAFYQRGFGASVEHLVQGPDPTDVVAQLTVGGARFWLSTASEEMRRFSPDSIGGATGRVLLVIADPDALAAKVLDAGATLLSEVGEEHGWRLGRLKDPFGHEWEIGHPVGVWPPTG
jgi:PhnB protein